MLRLTSEILSEPGIAHGFFGRTDGVSQGMYASLNCGTGSKDRTEDVAENRRRVLQALGGDALATVYQIHSPNAVIVREPWQTGQNPKADAMVTDRTGLALGILTADCAPILLADPEVRIIGAAHAGWNGALSGIVESAVAAMEQLGARRERLRAAIGPCIGQAAYEVGPEFEARFRAADSANARFFRAAPRADHFHFALESYVADRLTRSGVAHVTPLAACTYTDEGAFFSYRRTTHRKEADYGRQISAIMLTD